MDQLRAPLEKMSFDVFRVCSEINNESGKKDENFVVGAFAAASAAGLIYCGSGGKTAVMLKHLLHFDHLFEQRCTPQHIMIAFRQAVSGLTTETAKPFSKLYEQKVF